MARFEVTGPDGRKFEVNAPEGASQQDAIGYIQAQHYANKPSSGSLSDFGEQAVRGVNRAMSGVIGLPGEAVAGATNMIGAGLEAVTGARPQLFNDVANAVRWKPEGNAVADVLESPNAKPTNAAGRYGEAVGKAIGYSAVPYAGALRAGQALNQTGRAATTLGQIGRDIAVQTAARPGAAAAAEATAATAGSLGSQAAAERGAGPGMQMAAGMAAGITPFGIAQAARGSTQMVRRAMANQGRAGAYGKFAESLPMEVDDLAEAIASGTGRSTQQSRQMSARVFDVLGEEMTRAGGDANAAIAATVQRTSQELGLQPGTIQRRLSNMRGNFANSDLMLGEYPSVVRADIGQRNVAPDRVDMNALRQIDETQTQGLVDYLANSGNNRAATATRNAIRQRQPQLVGSMERTLDDVGPRVPTGPRSSRASNIDDVEQMQEAARQLGQQEYRRTYSGPINNRVSVVQLPRVLEGYRNRALGRSGDARDAMERALDQFYLQTPNGPVAMGTLQQLQDARGVLRGQIEAYRRQGRDDLVNAVQPIYRSITDLMGRMSPQWRIANQRWADYNFMNMAEELGQNVSLKRASPRYRELLREYEQLAPEAQQIVQIELLQQMRDQLDNVRDTRSIAQMFQTRHTREMVRRIFGPEAAARFTRAVRDLLTTDNSRAMLANSRTHVRGQVQREMDSDIGIQESINQFSLGGLRQWLLETGTALLRGRRDRPLADIVTTPMRDVPRVAQQFNELRNQQRRLYQLNQPARAVRPSGGLGGALATTDRRR